MKIKKFSVVLLAFILVGCQPKEISGKIVDKEFEPAHTSFWLLCRPIGKITVCQQMPLHHSDSWYLLILDEETGKDIKKEVPQYLFNSCKIGNSYSEKVTKQGWQWNADITCAVE